MRQNHDQRGRVLPAVFNPHAAGRGGDVTRPPDPEGFLWPIGVPDGVPSNPEPPMPPEVARHGPPMRNRGTTVAGSPAKSPQARCAIRFPFPGEIQGNGLLGPYWGSRGAQRVPSGVPRGRR